MRKRLSVSSTGSISLQRIRMHLFHRAHLTFQYPQPDRYPCNNHRYHAKQASLCDLSVSSTGSISLQQTLVHCESMRQWTTFSILNRIDIPATSPRSVKLVGENGPFSILNRIDIPATTSTTCIS